MRSNYRDKDWIRKYKFQFILSLSLILSPFIVYCHLLIDPNLTSFYLFGYQFELEDIPVQTFTWIILSTFISILIVCILFFSISDGWKYSLLIPLLIFIEHLLLSLGDLFGNQYTSLTVRIMSMILVPITVLSLDYLIFKKYRIHVIELKITSLLDKSSIINTGEINKKIRFLHAEFDKNRNSKSIYTLYSSKLYFEKILRDFNSRINSELIGNNAITNVLFVILVLVTSGFWFLHYIIPRGVTNYEIGFLNITSHGFYDVQVFVYYASLKLIVIVPMMICYITYHSWWRYAILSPLILYLFQFWEAIQDGYSNVDAFGNYKVFPLVLLSIILLLALSRIVRRHSRSLDIYEQITYEINSLINKLGVERSRVGDYRNRFDKIRNKQDSSKDTNLKELMLLKQELQNKVIS